MGVKRNSCKPKIPHLPHPITFLMVRPLLLNVKYIAQMKYSKETYCSF